MEHRRLIGDERLVTQSEGDVDSGTTGWLKRDRHIPGPGQREHGRGDDALATLELRVVNALRSRSIGPFRFALPLAAPDDGTALAPIGDDRGAKHVGLDRPLTDQGPPHVVNPGVDLDRNLSDEIGVHVNRQPDFLGRLYLFVTTLASLPPSEPSRIARSRSSVGQRHARAAREPGACPPTGPLLSAREGRRGLAWLTSPLSQA